MSEATADPSRQPSNGPEPPATARRRHPDEEGAFSRLQERTQTQLGFVNSLLITLAIGLLAFAVNASASSAELSRLGWRKWLVFSGLVTLAFSVLSGLRLAHNRLASQRMTTRVARLRQLRDRYRSERRDYELQRLGRQAVFFERWAKYSWSKVPEKQHVHEAARDLATLIPDECKVRRRPKQPAEDTRPPASGIGAERPSNQYIPGIPAATTRLVEALRTWYERADDWTWRWLRAQTWLFIVGAVLLVVVPLSYYFS